MYFLQDAVSKHHKSIIIPSIHHSLYRFNPCYLCQCCEWENDRAGSWGDNLSGDDSNAPHRRPITSNAQWRGEDVPDQDRGNVMPLHKQLTRGWKCLQWQHESMLRWNINPFPFKIPLQIFYLWVLGRVALWSCMVPQVTLSLKMRFRGQKTLLLFDFFSGRFHCPNHDRWQSLNESCFNFFKWLQMFHLHKQHRRWDMS